MNYQMTSTIVILSGGCSHFLVSCLAMPVDIGNVTHSSFTCNVKMEGINKSSLNNNTCTYKINMIATMGHTTGRKEAYRQKGLGAIALTQRPEVYW